MRNFAPEEIEGVRRLFKKNGYPEVDTSVGGRRVHYFVLPSSMNPNLPGFLYRATGDSKEDYVIGVDERVRADLRPFAVLEEYIEFLELGVNSRGRVAKAEGEVLRLLSTDLLHDYVSMRLGVFRKELELARRQPEKYLLTDEDREEFEAAIKLLEMSA